MSNNFFDVRLISLFDQETSILNYLII
jgi:hypothetical protein